MAIELGYDAQSIRFAQLENQIDRLFGRKPRNKYVCTVCNNRFVIDESFHGSADMKPCEACQGGELVRLANLTLTVEEHLKDAWALHSNAHIDVFQLFACARSFLPLSKQQSLHVISCPLCHAIYDAYRVLG